MDDDANVSITYLFTPILVTLFAFLFTLPGVEEEEPNESSEHAAKYTDSDDNIYPNAYLLSLIFSCAALLR